MHHHLTRDVFEDLRQERDECERLLVQLTESDWERESRCAGWTIADVVLHLAQTDEAVEAASGGRRIPRQLDVTPRRAVDEVMADWVAQERGASPDVLFARWRAGSTAALHALSAVTPERPLPWAVMPLKPRTLATTRLAEYWAHARDIAEPLSLTYPVTDRLWHVCWLAYRSLPYALRGAGSVDIPAVRLELSAPSGRTWSFGPAEASSTISGPAVEFASVAVRRRDPDEVTGLAVVGEGADRVLRGVRTYA